MRITRGFHGLVGCLVLLMCLAPLSGQTIPKPAAQKSVYIEPGPRVQSVQYFDGATTEVETETVWKPLCVDQSGRLTVDDLRAIAQLSKAAAAANPPPAEPQGGVAGVIPAPFVLNFNATTSMPAGALEALAKVKYYYESQFTDPITVTINIAFATLSPGVLGATSSSYINVTYANTRNGLVSGMDGDDVIQNFLPSGSTIAVRYDGNSATATNETRVFVTIADHRATVGSVSGTAASMTFNNQFPWDYDPPITGGTYDFQSVITHEVGHALGFTSGADFRTNDMEMLDLYRFQRSDGANDFNPDDFTEFTNTARLVDLNAPGTNDDSNSDLISVEYQMSDGSPNQASHFHDQSPAIGIMDPTIGAGQTFYPNFLRTSDLNMFDAIGWDYPHLNQSCPAAREMSCNSTVHPDVTTLSDVASPLFSCGNGTSHVGALWYSFTATHDSAHISTCDSLSADPTFAVYDGECGNLVEIACGEDGGCAGSTKAGLCVTGLVPGKIYYIQLAARNAASRGIIELDLECSCDGACCIQSPPSCTVTDEDSCTGLGGVFAGGNTTCLGDSDLDGRDDACQSSYLTYGQVPTSNQEDLASNLDISDSVPDTVLVEGFTSDGRPVRRVRWWGSVLDAGVNPDGWFVGFHEPRTTGGAQAPALGLYFCGSEVVDKVNMDFDSCAPEAVIQYTVELVGCCLVNANPDSRSSLTPATPGGFLTDTCTDYALSIQALVGRRYDSDGLGGCTAAATPATATSNFWGWHSTVDDEVAGQALSTIVTEVGPDWVFDPWAPAAASCGNPDTAFELYSSDPLNNDCNCNGIPDDQDVLVSDCNANGVPDECEPDCNGNGVPDDCDVTLATSLDCQGNGRPDECDVSYGYSVDSNGDNVPDECCQVISTPLRDPGDSNKCRFITVPSAPAGLRAVRVRLVSLHHPNPPYAAGAVSNFSSFEGQVRWLGPPVQYVESAGSGIPFKVSTLQCAPYYADWSTIGLVHVSGREVVPSSSYDVQWITEGCIESSELSFSSALNIPTTRWGDIELPFSPPDGTTQPDLGDVSAAINKFKNQPAAIIKARALLAGEVPDPTLDYSFTDIAACVDAFKGAAYPNAGPTACP